MSIGGSLKKKNIQRIGSETLPCNGTKTTILNKLFLIANSCIAFYVQGVYIHTRGPHLPPVLMASCAFDYSRTTSARSYWKGNTTSRETLSY